MNGFRKDNPECKIPENGQYGRDANGEWFGTTPTGEHANLSAHHVTEHEDGTITASPSILISYGPDGKFKWHGWLEKGEWRKC